MFHIFYVNEGYMMVLEPSSLRLVLDLQKCIQEKAKVEVHEQVLFLATGESISSNASLASYMSVGSDSNPIYLIRRIQAFEREKFTTSEQEGINVFYKNWQAGVDKLEKSDKPHNSTIASEYSKLAKYGLHVTDMMFKFCGKIVAEHKHLHTGWVAVISNLDDNATRIQRRLDRLSTQAENLKAVREKGLELLSDFDAVLKTLSMIVIPNQLLNAASSSSSSQATASSGVPMGTAEGSGSSDEEMSLYDWISSKDSAYSLDELVPYIRDHLEKTNDTDLRDSKANFEAVSKLVRRPEYREIRGIEKRLATLDSRLRSVEGLCFNTVEEKTFNLPFLEKHLLMRELATHIIQPSQDSSVNVVNYQRSRISEFSRCLAETYQIAVSFINSKVELLKNICQRLACWVQQAYERLHRSNKRMVVFEEKYNGLRQRLDLVRQIKEAPIMYVTAVAEVIRRDALQKDFSMWMIDFSEKCEKFIGDENKIRAEFYTKLEKHFLRQLFFGMSDIIPNFCPATVKIDKNLPRVAISHLRDLRRTFPEMHEFLNVTYPQVYSRLTVVDPNVPTQPSGAFGNNLRREESFYVREKTTNIEAMNQNFPSTKWLSEEHMDMSPANNPFVASKQGGFGASCSSLHIDAQSLTSPMELGPLSEFGSNHPSPAQKDFDADSARLSMSPLGSSSSMTIPISSSAQMDASSSTIKQQLSNSSSHFGTPDDHLSNYGSPDKNLLLSPQIASPDITRPNSLLPKRRQQDLISESLEIFPNSPLMIPEIIRSKCSELNIGIIDIAKFFANLKKLIQELQMEMRNETKKNWDILQVALNAARDELHSSIIAAKEENEDTQKMFVSLKEKFESDTKELKEIVEHERYLRKEKEKELDEQKRLSEKLNSEFLAVIKAKDDLHVDLLRVEQERAQLKNQLDLDLSVDYFSIELKAVEQLLKRELTNEETQQLKRDIDKQKLSKIDESDNFLCQSQSSTSMNKSSIRSEYEKAFRNKMEFIVKGVEEKKNKEMLAMCEEIETELRKESSKYIEKLKQRIADLEDRVLFFESIEQKESEREKSWTVDVSKKIMVDSALQVSLDQLSMQESCILLNRDMKIETDDNKLTNESDSLKESEYSVESKRQSVFTENDPLHVCITEAKISVRTQRKFIEMRKKAAEMIDEAEEAVSDCDTRSTSLSANCEKATQTRMRMRDMIYLIALKNIHEGSSVLIMWNYVHKTYMVFCASSMLYIVHEASIHDMGIEPSDKTQRRWHFAIVKGTETCQIKKATNRYNLPLNSRFVRVSVSPLSLDMASFSSGSRTTATAQPTSTKTEESTNNPNPEL